jgi:DNA polymerase III subunit delta'
LSFKVVYGHEKQISILQAAALRNRVPHAYLFYGMKGIGKRTVAEIFAKALNCETQRASSQGKDVERMPENFDSCDGCPSCFKVDRKNHSDIMTIKADGQFIKVKEIRDLQDQMKFAPLEGGKRVFIMIDADKMNSISANALLKTLEEPSRSNILILITSSPYELPMTILSRCQHLRFHPLHRNTVASYLRDRLSLDTEKACSIASSSGGSIGKALDINEDSYLTLRDEILKDISTFCLRDPLSALSFMRSFSREKEEMTDCLNVLLTGYRDALTYKETGDDNSLINRDCAAIIKSIAKGLSGEDILRNIKIVNRAISAIDRNANKQLTLEAMMFKLIPVIGADLKSDSI